jgi:hypothetical protein
MLLQEISLLGLIILISIMSGPMQIHKVTAEKCTVKSNNNETDEPCRSQDDSSTHTK